MRFIIVSGLSGSGKSIAMHTLEDIGFYCVDNLPLALLDAFADEVRRTGDPQGRYAVGIDARNLTASLASFPHQLERLQQQGLAPELVFLDADDATLIKRFSETRRKHPLSHRDLPLAEAIRRERALIDPIASLSHLRIDSSRTHLHQLRDQVTELVGGQRSEMTLLFQSFGYKHGLPVDADYVFDLRCLPNPYWESELRGLSGREAAVDTFLQRHPIVTRMYNDLKTFLDHWIERFAADNRRYLTVALGCTGGQHRSVWMVERLAATFDSQPVRVLVRHRELGRE